MMNKILVTSALTMLAMLSITLPVYANIYVEVTIDGASVNFDGQHPVIVDGHVFIPVRGVFEPLGFDVDWHESGEIRRIIIRESGGDSDMVFNIGNGTITNAVDTVIYRSDVLPQIIDGAIMFPVGAMIAFINHFDHYATWSTWSTALFSLSVLSSDLREDIMRIMNEEANRVRERGEHVVVLGPEHLEVVRSYPILPGRPGGRAYTILYVMVDGEVVTIGKSGFFSNSRTRDIFDHSKSRTRYLHWTTQRPPSTPRVIIPVYHIQLFDDEVLLLKERFSRPR
ncbi:MAG: copper amine oxidase N-terminal domain-containing protein [Chitinispirillales bacterium]|jgi:hypothetical protein|nr:copper amine oxidase N-terminal domain-containing protein [Chitinispirillales bacterium]